MDLSNLTQTSINIAVEKAWLAIGGVELLLCFFTYTGPLTLFLDTSEQQIEATTSVNFKCVCLFSIALGKKMERAGIGGSFVFVTSIINKKRGLFLGVAILGASIAAIKYLTRVMALELGKHKIQVNAIARGLYESDALLNTLSNEALDKDLECKIREFFHLSMSTLLAITYVGNDSDVVTLADDKNFLYACFVQHLNPLCFNVQVVNGSTKEQDLLQSSKHPSSERLNHEAFFIALPQVTTILDVF
ncbi:hypothetical protein L7F22_003338 [Adiantum nelumboides]|nr:hypothetical protein [Adiantum nelumboides]